MTFNPNPPMMPGALPNAVPPLMSPGMGPPAPDLTVQPQFYLDESTVRRYAALDPGVWSRRDSRMLRHRRLFELVKPPKNKLKPGQKPALTTDAKHIVFKFAGMFGSHPPSITCVSEDSQNTIAAERCADFLRSYRRKEVKRYGRGPHGPRPIDEAIYAVRDGTVVEMITWDPDPANASHPFESRLLDPMTVYPTYTGDKLTRVTWKYRTTISEAKELCDKYGRSDILPNAGTASFRQDSLPVTVTKVVCNEGGQWELGVMVNSTLVTVLPIGYNPFLVTHVNARIYSSTSVGDMTNMDRYENVGVGIFDALEEAIKNKNETYSLMREMMNRDANPPRVIFTDDEGKLDDLKFEPGENIHLWADDKFQLVQLTPDFRKLEAVMQIDAQSISRSTIPDLLWGEGGNGSSAAEYMALGNARDQIFIYKTALECHYEAKYEHILMLYGRFANALTPGSIYPGATFSSSTLGSGIKLGGQQFTVADVSALGPEPDVVVEYSDVTPQNEAARAQMAATLTDKKIIDLYTARQFGVPAPYNQQPELIGQRVLADISLMHPMMTQIMAMTAALMSPNDVQRAIAGLMLPGLINQAQSAGGPAGGANPTPGANGVPSSNTHMNPQANPAESGNRAGMPEGQPTAPNSGSQPGQPSR